MSKKSYFHGNGKKKTFSSRMAYEAHRQKEIANKVEQATFDGVKYGMLAMEMIMISLNIDENNKNEIKQKFDKMKPYIEEYNKMLTEQYIPLEEFASRLHTQHPNIDADVLVEIDPKLGAYF